MMPKSGAESSHVDRSEIVDKDRRVRDTGVNGMDNEFLAIHLERFVGAQ